MDLLRLILISDSALHQATGLLFVVTGVLVCIRMLNYPDLTIDGSFTIGACVFAILTVSGIHGVLCMLGGTVAGALAGILTVTLNEKCRIGQILSSVLVMLAAIAAAPYILGGATVGLLGQSTILSELGRFDQLISDRLLPVGSPFMIHPITTSVLWLFGLSALWCVLLFLRTRTGCLLRYHGSAGNPRIILRGSLFRIKLLALGMGNGFVALGATIEAQRRGSVDQRMGTGMILIALSSLILGETILRVLMKKEHLSVRQEGIAVVLGAILYAFITQFVIALRQPFVDIRLVSVVFLAIMLAISSRRYPRNLEMF